jgi:hypothetical protein
MQLASTAGRRGAGSHALQWQLQGQFWALAVASCRSGSSSVRLGCQLTAGGVPGGSSTFSMERLHKTHCGLLGSCVEEPPFGSFFESVAVADTACGKACHAAHTQAAARPSLWQATHSCLGSRPMCALVGSQAFTSWSLGSSTAESLPMACGQAAVRLSVLGNMPLLHVSTRSTGQLSDGP